jgi:hypothetical protein
MHTDGGRRALQSDSDLVLGAAVGGRHNGRVLSNDEDVAVSNRFWERPGIRMGIRQLGGSERGVSRARCSGQLVQGLPATSLAVCRGPGRLDCPISICVVPTTFDSRRVSGGACARTARTAAGPERATVAVVRTTVVRDSISKRRTEFLI